MEPPSDPISEQLQQARERAGLSIEDVHFKTRLPKSVLQALEAGDFEIFSSPTYARSFLTQYSEYLGVDASRWIDALQPGAFVGDEYVHPWMEAPKARSNSELEIHIPSKTSSPTLLSAGVIYAAMKGYNYLENRYGAESQVPAAMAEVKNSTPPAPKAEPLQAEVAARNEGEPIVTNDALKGVPRAIIVR